VTDWKLWSLRAENEEKRAARARLDAAEAQLTAARAASDDAAIENATNAVKVAQEDVNGCGQQTRAVQRWWRAVEMKSRKLLEYYGEDVDEGSDVEDGPTAQAHRIRVAECIGISRHVLASALSASMVYA
jgi:hypothetical protein